MTVLKWSWRHHVLQVDEFESVDEAVGAAFWEREEGEAAPDHIEVVAADRSVRRIEDDELTDLMRNYETAQSQTLPNDPRPYVAKVVIQSAAGDEATFDWYRDMAEAESDFLRLEDLLGARVTLVVL
jgi:hypothetical protein